MKIEQRYFAHSTAVVDEGASIGEETRIWHFTHIMPDSIIGRNCNIGQNVFVASNVRLGDNVKVQNNVSIYEGVVCDDDVFLGPSMVFTNVLESRSAISRKDEYRPTMVGKGATIGANATIVCGHDIGRYAFVGAGAVVTRSVPDYAMVAGNPALQIGWVSEYGHKLNFDKDGIAICPESGQRYRLEQNSIAKISDGEESQNI